jgi:hypothetical protein
MVGLALDQPIGRGTPPFLPARAKATSLTFIKMRQNAYYLRVIIAVGVHSDGRTSLTAGAQSCPKVVRLARQRGDRRPRPQQPGGRLPITYSMLSDTKTIS